MLKNYLKIAFRNLIRFKAYSAKKYFGDENLIGKTLKITTRDGQKDYLVTGVFKDLPSNTHFSFNMLASWMSLNSLNPPQYDSQWIYTYLLFRSGISIDDLNKNFTEYVRKNSSDDTMFADASVFLQPLQDIHLKSHRKDEMKPGGEANAIYIFSMIALLILAIACFNFMNLTTARALSRAKEVGIRRAIGSSRLQLIRQFLGEAIILSFIAVLIAGLLVGITIPLFNQITGKDLSFDYFSNPSALLFLVALSVIVGVAAGGYPAFFLSAFQPVKALKGDKPGGKEKITVRQVLVTAQFTVSIILIIGTAVIYDQLEFVRNKNLGFDKEQVVVISLLNTSLMNEPAKIESFKNSLLLHPRIDAVTSSSNKLGERIWIWDFRPEGWTEAQHDWMVQAQGVSHDYLKTYGIDLVEGRDFSPEFPADTNNSVIINQAAAEALGWENPIGKTMLTPVQLGRNRAKVIGVVKDFHFVSLHQKIEPLVFMLSNRLRFVSIKVHAAELNSTIDYMEDQWNEFEPNVPFNYEFVDEKFAQLYESEENTGTITGYFSALAIFVACLGLLGLVSLATEQKKKEIGIRKVLGASVTGVVYLISKEFLKLILIAFVIAAPLAYFFMNRWLEDFAYRTEINLWVFIAAGLAVVCIAVVTLIFQAIKAAAANPVNSLRYE